MEPVIEQDGCRIYCGDCISVMRSLPAASFDSVVTDPPYGLEFMGKEWDGADGFRRSLNKADADRDSAFGRASPTSPEYRAGHLFQDFCQAWATECLRLLKPGGHLLAFGGSRTYHRMACAIEDAGFEIRDQIQWIYGSGFPKSRNGAWGGTALKPAHEPIVMARKPLIGTVAKNVAEHGVGALNIDGCRVDLNGDYKCKANGRPSQTGLGDKYDPESANEADTLGRWPANVIHDGSAEVIEAFPDAPGQQRSVGPEFGAKDSVNTFGDYGPRDTFLPRTDAGSAARFFYCAKADRTDRDDGMGDAPERPLLWSSGTKSPCTFQAEGTNRSAKNNHPTVKPTDLMRYLVRLVTPSGGVVLDPFLGSGSTGRGAVLEHCRFVGIEKNPEYVETAVRRITHVMRQGLLFAPTADKEVG